jgi:hypothetical protein
VGFSHLIGAPVDTVADFGTKYGEPLSMMMAVYGGVAEVGHALQTNMAITAREARNVFLEAPFICFALLPA